MRATPDAQPQSWDPTVSHRHLVALHRVDLSKPKVRTALPTLLVLAEFANHKTGRSCPTQARFERRGIPYGTWWRHVQTLEAAGLITQVEKGRNGTAAEYYLNYADADVNLESETPTPSRVSKTTQDLGRGLEDESAISTWRADLTQEEHEAWLELGLLRRLSAAEREAVSAEWPTFRRSPELVRLCLALTARGASRPLVERVTAHGRGKASYEGARTVLPVVLARVRALAAEHGLHPRSEAYSASDALPTADGREAFQSASSDLGDVLASLLPGFGVPAGVGDEVSAEAPATHGQVRHRTPRRRNA